VDEWKKSDVHKWLAVLQMSKYEESFKTVSGKASIDCLSAVYQGPVAPLTALSMLQRLLQLSAADVYRFAGNKQDADTLLESIQSLRETGVRK